MFFIISKFLFLRIDERVNLFSSNRVRSKFSGMVKNRIKDLQQQRNVRNHCCKKFYGKITNLEILVDRYLQRNSEANFLA
ncbi:uncharacterized protein Gasu_15720 [Galdieria sulphuraria]|uniref:Uncharacterized protein n=1 Tax=Galdieria sulphuraria TaxID=130081 RepID=M2X3R6_GALSU|nr:uncharacterized protein Gasu_15720 [Galdieria sulphuraria]EME31065.1 hypothetical protein Gasu_15720 [Galdieria sulphuraria]|eukprot:XP_005707585.1 hypothetical protein Gasu_15720 [Galdieria sulphuraria]